MMFQIQGYAVRIDMRTCRLPKADGPCFVWTDVQQCAGISR